MDNQNKLPWEMPTPPEHVARIIEKSDRGLKLSESEHQQVEAWEDSQGGFAGIPIKPEH